MKPSVDAFTLPRNCLYRVTGWSLCSRRTNISLTQCWAKTTR